MRWGRELVTRPDCGLDRPAGGISGYESVGFSPRPSIRPQAVECSGRFPPEPYPLGGEGIIKAGPKCRNPPDKGSTRCGALVTRWYGFVPDPSSPAATPLRRGACMGTVGLESVSLPGRSWFGRPGARRGNRRGHERTGSVGGLANDAKPNRPAWRPAAKGPAGRHGCRLSDLAAQPRRARAGSEVRASGPATPGRAAWERGPPRGHGGPALRSRYSGKAGRPPRGPAWRPGGNRPVWRSQAAFECGRRGAAVKAAMRPP